jgi:HSP20 family molecular chaperone IbpA
MEKGARFEEPEIIEREDETRIIVPIDSVSKEELSVFVSGSVLLIEVKGLGSLNVRLKRKDYDLSSARAKFNNGILEIRLPISR